MPYYSMGETPVGIVRANFLTLEGYWTIKTLKVPNQMGEKIKNYISRPNTGAT